QTEGDIGQAQRGLDIGKAPLHFANGLDRLDAVPAGFLLSCGNREGQAVENDVALAQPEVLCDVGDRPLRDAYLPLRYPRLAFLVDGEHDHGRAVLRDQAHDSAETRVGPVAVLVVGGVDHRAATETFQACSQYRRLRGVQHDGQGRCGRQPEGNIPHVGDAVSADVVDIEIEHVRAVPDLGPRDVDAVIPALGEQGVAERP